MQQYTVYLYLQTALHVSGCISTHHQELISLYLQYLALLRPLLLPVMGVTGWELDGKHVEQFADINILYIVASCWIIIDTYYAMHGPLNTRFNERLICIVRSEALK